MPPAARRLIITLRGQFRRVGRNSLIDLASLGALSEG